ncbi:hypothetical protein SLS54_006474 [Diplodia seriata]
MATAAWAETEDQEANGNAEKEVSDDENREAVPPNSLERTDSTMGKWLFGGRWAVAPRWKLLEE